MANAFYEKAAQKFGQGTLSWAGTLKVALLKNDYAVDLVNHEFYSSASSAAVGTDQTIANPAVLADGVLDGDNVIWTALADPSEDVTQLVIYKYVTGPSDSPLIMYIDTMSGLPFRPNGTDVNITWDNGSDRIARL